MNSKIAIYIIVTLFCLTFAYNRIVYKSKREGMSLPSAKYFQDKYILLQDDKVYDEFYVSIYDQLFSDPSRIVYELNETSKQTKLNENAQVLDIGSATGHHLHAMKQYTTFIEGIDKSKAMVQYARKKHADIKFTLGDATESILFEDESFTHITCFYFTLYHFRNKKEILSNIYRWLEPGGYFIVHLVNRKMFDPILAPANPLVMVSPQKYAKKRITTSVIKFNDFSYHSEFKLDDVNDEAIFEEIFKYDDNGHVRKHVQHFHAPKLKTILEIAKDVGFNIINKIDMVECEYEYQYIYIMQK